MEINSEDYNWTNWISNNKLFHFVVLIILPLIVYYSTTGFGYSGLDDTLIIRDHLRTLKNIHNFRFLFCTDAFLRNPGGVFYRPIQSLSFMFDTIIGRGWVGMYHLSSLLIHIGTVISLYILLNLLHLKKSLSFLFTLIFAVHPMLTSNISWIPARGDLLIGLIGIWIFSTFHLYSTTNKILYLVLHGLLFMVGIFTKETVILFPAVLLFYTWAVLSRKNFIKSSLPFSIIWAVIAITYYLLRHKAIHPLHSSGALVGIHPLIHNLIEIPIMIGKIFIPQGLTTLPLYDNLSITIGLLISLPFLYFTYKSWKEKKWTVLFGLIWFILFSFLPLITRVRNANYFFNYLEHRSYLPIIGLIIAVSFFIAEYKVKIKPALSIAAGIILISLFSFLTYSHSQDYKDIITFYSAAIKSNPDKNAYAYNNRAMAFYDQKDDQESISDHDMAISIFQSADLYYNKGYTEFKMKDMATAMHDFTKAITLDSGQSDAFIYRSTIYDGLKQYDNAMKDIEIAEKQAPDKALVYCKKGNIYLHQNKFEEAIKLYTKSIQMNKYLIEPFNKRAQAYFMIKEYEKAIADCKQALAFKIENKDVYSNMGMIYLEMGKMEQSIESFSNIIKENSNDKEAYFDRAIVEQKAGKLSSACTDWKTALQLGINPAQDSLNKYCK